MNLLIQKLNRVTIKKWNCIHIYIFVLIKILCSRQWLHNEVRLAIYNYYSSTIFQMIIHTTICQYAFNIPSAPVIKFQHLFDNPWNMIVDCGQKISFHCFKWSHIRVFKVLSPYVLKIIPLLSTKSAPAQKRLRVYGKTVIYLNCFWMG